MVRPDIRKAGGPGRYRLFSFFNVFEVAIAKHLHNYGLEAERIRRILQGLRYQAAQIRPTVDVTAARRAERDLDRIHPCAHPAHGGMAGRALAVPRLC